MKILLSMIRDKQVGLLKGKAKLFHKDMDICTQTICYTVIHVRN